MYDDLTIKFGYKLRNFVTFIVISTGYQWHDKVMLTRSQLPILIENVLTIRDK